VTTAKRVSACEPNVVIIGTSAASRPRAIKIRPIRARLIVSRVERKPATAKKGFEPSVEIHRRRIGRNPDVAEVAVAIARRDIETSAQRNGDMSEVAAYADALG